MQSFKEFTANVIEEVTSADEVPAQAQEAADYLSREISKLLPDFYKVNVRYSERLGRDISILVVDTRKEGISVTWHNSENIAHFMMHLSTSFGKPANVSKVSFENLDSSYFPEGVKYRKVSGKTIMEVSKKMVNWFKKHTKAFAESPANRM